MEYQMSSKWGDSMHNSGTDQSFFLQKNGFFTALYAGCAKKAISKGFGGRQSMKKDNGTLDVNIIDFLPVERMIWNTCPINSQLSSVSRKIGSERHFLPFITRQPSPKIQSWVQKTSINTTWLALTYPFLISTEHQVDSSKQKKQVSTKYLNFIDSIWVAPSINKRRGNEEKWHS